MLGDQMVLNKSIGFDFQVFDKDTDESFSFASWGKGGSKYRDPHSLGDAILLPAAEKLITLSGTVGWDTKIDMPLPVK